MMIQRSFLREKKRTPFYRDPKNIAIGFIVSLVLLAAIKTVLIKSDTNAADATSTQDTINSEKSQMVTAASPTQRIDPSYYQEVLSWSPRIFLVKNFVSPAECEQLINLAKSKLAPIHKEGEELYPKTSGGMAFYDPSDVEWLDTRISHLTHMSVDHGETLVLVKYAKGDQQASRRDYITPGTSPELDQQIVKHGNRILALFIYLNDDYEGGTLTFKKSALSVKVKRGDALLLHTTTPNSELDETEEHSVSQITSGDMYLAMKWIRAVPDVEYIEEEEEDEEVDEPQQPQKQEDNKSGQPVYNFNNI